MLFNSEIFILLFLPLSLIVFFLLGKFSPRAAILGIILFSLVFYGWFQPKNLWIVLFSLLANYAIALEIHLARELHLEKRWFYIGVFCNALILGYFKYTNFIINNLNIFGLEFQLKDIALPLAISFFTFQQISFLADVKREKFSFPSFDQYIAFILFFPQLIAGPILRQKEFFPQLGRAELYRPNLLNLSIGTTIFVFGLFKKTIFADFSAKIANPVFAAAEIGESLHFLKAWMGLLAFSFQIYFDFSGYSDMAVGLARMFNIVFPINFFSPYKAVNIIDFWRRWHISLSNFLKDHIYIPLGGNRKGILRRFGNLFITMLIGGLWHGASWTFVIWGALHGIFLAINHLWRAFRSETVHKFRVPFFLKRLNIFILVSLAWVFFRSATFSGSLNLFKGLFGFNGFVFPNTWMKFLHFTTLFTPKNFVTFMPPEQLMNGFNSRLGFLFFLMIVIWKLPNIYEWLSDYRPSLDAPVEPNFSNGKLLWSPNLTYLVVALMLWFISFLNLREGGEFIYFQF